MTHPQTSAAEETFARLRDCRVYLRHPCDAEASCLTVTDGPKMCWPAHICNISQASVALVVTRRFEKGTSLLIELPSPEPGVILTLLARVVHAAAQPDGSWLLGCLFACDLTREEVEAMLCGSP
jgi:hypothetical protein